MAPLPVLTVFLDVLLRAKMDAEDVKDLVRVFRRLVSLDLAITGLSDETASLLLSLTSLQTLKVESCSSLTDVGQLQLETALAKQYEVIIVQSMLMRFVVSIMTALSLYLVNVQHC